MTWNKWSAVQNTQEIYTEQNYQGRVRQHGINMAIDSDLDTMNRYCFYYMYCFQLGWKEGKMIKLLEGKP